MTTARIAGLEKVTAMILDRKLGNEESLAMRLVENIHREDLDPIDEAEAYLKLRDMETNVSAKARLVGKERTYVSHALRLLKLHPKVRETVRQHTLPREHALALLRLSRSSSWSLRRRSWRRGSRPWRRGTESGGS